MQSNEDELYERIRDLENQLESERNKNKFLIEREIRLQRIENIIKQIKSVEIEDIKRILEETYNTKSEELEII